jgi:hypothetical protein
MRAPRPMRTMVLVSVLASAACFDDSITGTRPLTMDLDVSPRSAAVGQDVTARYTTTGSGIFRVIVAWGDGAADTVAYSGAAVEASQPVVHRFDAPGTFLIQAAVTAGNGTRSDTASVVIN